jgi:hypothetical protein
MPHVDKAKYNAYQREYHRTHREADNKWRANNRERLKGYRRRYWQKHRKQEQDRHKRYRAKNREAINKKNAVLAKLLYAKRRLLVLTHYSNGPPKCSCCPETEIRFLSIDHIDGGGRKHRKRIGGSSSALYRWIMENNYPSSFQVLCMNCNFAKGQNNICPHKLNGSPTNSSQTGLSRRE